MMLPYRGRGRGMGRGGVPLLIGSHVIHMYGSINIIRPKVLRLLFFRVLSYEHKIATLLRV